MAPNFEEHVLVVLNIKFPRSRILDNHATYNVVLTFDKLCFRGLRCHHENCVILSASKVWCSTVYLVTDMASSFLSD